MLFNSFPFLAGFLPLALAGLYFARRWGGQSGALAWIIGISLIFYSWWMPIFACLLIASVLANFLLSKRIEKDSQLPRVRKTWLILGITGNLIILAYFKYAGWLLQTFHMFPTVADNLRDLSLPLGISFFTFQQIAFLIDTYRGQTRTYTFPHYCFFVTFFPQLIAGPIARHHQILPQLANKISLTLRSRYFAIGITLFLIGLFKKVILADSIAKYPAKVFSAADSGIILTWFEAWGGTILYTFQLYYDFSGYSDMALGLGLLFGIRLPINFNSPYKAVNIADFWRRWHISLSLFFRDYVYIPLGGNRVSTRRGFTNVLFTMLLIGLWHGAGWTFLLWGLFHAALLIIYRIWQMSYSTLGKGPPRATLGGRALARAVTFVAVMVGWMLFNASSVGVATSMFTSMLGMNGISLVDHDLANWSSGITWMILLSLITFWGPNSYQLLYRYRHLCLIGASTLTPYRVKIIHWRPNVLCAMIVVLVALFAITGLTKKTLQFLYFQF